MVCVHGTRVPITKSEYQSLCDLHDEGTFMATFGLWHKTEKKWVNFQNGGPDLFDETCDAKLLHEGDIRAFASSVREYGGHGTSVESKTSKVPTCKTTMVLRWKKGLCGVRISGVKMVRNKNVVDGPHWLGWWALMCQKKRARDQRRLRTSVREMKKMSKD